jgi:hypothetical protein
MEHEHLLFLLGAGIEALVTFGPLALVAVLSWRLAR